MEDKKRLSRNCAPFKIELLILEIIFFLLTLTFYIMVYITYPTSATCDVVETQIWVTILMYVFIIFMHLPVYSIFSWREIRIRDPWNLIRLGSIIIAAVFSIVYIIGAGCRIYVNLNLYMIIVLLSLVFPILLQLLILLIRKIIQSSKEEKS